MTCGFNADYSKVELCQTDYNVVYKEVDKKTITVEDYNVIATALNISDLATASDGAYYRDRKYVYIDKTKACQRRETLC